MHTEEQSPLLPKELFPISKSLFKSGFPISLTFLAGFINTSISLHFAGYSGNPAELAGVGIGYTCASFFTMGLFLSIDQGFSILASKLFGAKKYHELGILYQRNLFILTALSIPIILFMLFSYRVLQTLGLTEDVSTNAGIFLRSMIPSLIGTYLFSSTKYFLISQNVYRTPTIIIFALIPVHAVLCHFFVDIHKMHVSGIGYARSITDITAAILLFAYIRFADVSRDTWIPWTKECMKNWDSHLKRTFILGGTTLIEFIVYQFSSFMIGRLNNIVFLAAHGVAVNLASTIYCIPGGFSLSMQAIVGNAIGEGHKEKVKKILAGGIILNVITSSVIALPLVIFRNQISSFFIMEEAVKDVLQNMLVFVALAHIPESFGNIIGGVLKVVGKEKEVFGAFIGFYFCFCLFGQWVFGRIYGYIAIWLCTAAAGFLMFAFVAYQVWALDWNQQIWKVKRALDEQIYAETQSLIEFTDITS